MMSDAVRVSAPVTIRAELSVADPDTCKFTVSRTLIQWGTLFRQPGASCRIAPRRAFVRAARVAHVLVAENVVAVGKTQDALWPELVAGQIAAIVRSQLLTGAPAILQAPRPARAGKRTDTEIRELVQVLLDREVNPSVAARRHYHPRGREGRATLYRDQRRVPGMRGLAGHAAAGVRADGAPGGAGGGRDHRCHRPFRRTDALLQTGLAAITPPKAVCRADPCTAKT